MVRPISSDHPAGDSVWWWDGAQESVGTFKEVPKPEIKFPEYKPYKEYWICGDCGVLVRSMVKHDTFHAMLQRVADSASYGDMLRPIG